jgi:hypothetical protein
LFKPAGFCPQLFQPRLVLPDLPPDFINPLLITGRQLLPPRLVPLSLGFPPRPYSGKLFFVPRDFPLPLVYGFLKVLNLLSLPDKYFLLTGKFLLILFNLFF